MGGKYVKLTENDLRTIVSQSVEKVIKEACSQGWTVDASEVDDAYNLAAEHFGNEELNAQIVRCLGDEVLAKCLAYVFRVNDFREWRSRFD